MTDSINVYPSTYDGPTIIAGGSPEADALKILENARKRYAKYGSGHVYVDRNKSGRVVEVCAVGAVIAADRKAKPFVGACDTRRFIEERLSTAARTAMRLLDEKALELYPSSAGYPRGGYLGPLEYVNQSNRSRPLCEDPLVLPWSERKEAVLRVYDAVITDLRATPVHA